MLTITELNTLSILYTKDSERIGSFIECVNKVKALRERNFPYIPAVTLERFGIKEEELDLFVYFCGLCNQPIEPFENGFKFI